MSNVARRYFIKQKLNRRKKNVVFVVVLKFVPMAKYILISIDLAMEKVVCGICVS